MAKLHLSPIPIYRCFKSQALAPKPDILQQKSQGDTITPWLTLCNTYKRTYTLFNI